MRSASACHSASKVKAAVLPGVDAALPRLAKLAEHLEALRDDAHTFADALGAQAALVRYTHAVLDAVRQDLRDTVAGLSPSATGRYAEALPILEAVDRRFKGLWGGVDLPIIHSFFAATAHAQ